MNKNIFNKKKPLYVFILITLGIIAVLFFTQINYSGDLDIPKKSNNIETIGIGFGYNKNTKTILDDPSIENLFPHANDYIDILWDQKSTSTDIPTAHAVGLKVMCIFLSLDKAREALNDQKSDEENCDYFGYNPETPKKTQQTTSSELNNFVESVRGFSELAKKYKAPSVIGPGFQIMAKNEEYYVQASKYADIWLIQTQVLTLDKTTNKKATPEEYRKGVEKIIKLIHQGNPATKIWLQIIISIDPLNSLNPIFTPEEIVEYIKAVDDIAENVRIYTGGNPAEIESITKIIKYLRQ